MTTELKASDGLTEKFEKDVVPVVGMGATVHFYSDSQACTIIKVSKSGKEITLQRDKAILLNGVTSRASDALQFFPGGFCGHTSGRQRYDYHANPEGVIFKARLRKNGIWVRCGTKNSTISMGVRSEHYDFNF